MKKYLIQIFGGAMLYLVFGWFVFDFSCGGYTDKNTTQLQGFKKSPQDFNYLFLVISCLAYSCFITFIIAYLQKTTSVKKGFFIAATIGLLVAIMTDSYWYASSNFYSNIEVVVLDIACAALTVGVLGSFIACINRICK